ncbi:MAG: ribonuclease III [Selenomonadaceae bacterium]|nr:ribonuclease III [Selenomonadaceae bacterium]
MAEKKFELAPLPPARRRQLQQLAKKLGVEFTQIEFLHVALTHKSYAKKIEEDAEAANKPVKKIAHNERLEFLGDAVLELASSTYLFNKFDNLSEGELTKTRAAIVCGPTLAKLAKNLGFGEVLLLSYGENAGGGRERESNLEDAFEAVIGAIYLDKGWEVAKDYVWRQLADEFKNVKVGKIIIDVKSVLQEFSQREYSGALPEYIEISMDGPPHDRTFESAVKLNGEILGYGVGKSKQLAEKMAAEEALKKLKIID